MCETADIKNNELSNSTYINSELNKNNEYN